MFLRILKLFAISSVFILIVACQTKTVPTPQPVINLSPQNISNGNSTSHNISVRIDWVEITGNLGELIGDSEIYFELFIIRENGASSLLRRPAEGAYKPTRGEKIYLDQFSVTINNVQENESIFIYLLALEDDEITSSMDNNSELATNAAMNAGSAILESKLASGQLAVLLGKKANIAAFIITSVAGVALDWWQQADILGEYPVLLDQNNNYLVGDSIEDISQNGNLMLKYSITSENQVKKEVTEANEVQNIKIDGMTQIHVPAGEFIMGSADGPPNTTPLHTVYLDEFWIDMTEISNSMYARCVKDEDGACEPPVPTSSVTRDSYYGNPAYANYPVIYVNWHDAQNYCNWAGRRLPTEAEWEKAARGTDDRIFPWGNQSGTCNVGNFYVDAYCTGDTAEIGSYPGGASIYGVLDMGGNVWEWTADWYDGSYYDYSPSRNPFGPAIGDGKSLRGGSWYTAFGYARVFPRIVENTTTRAKDEGFRCVR